MYIGIDPGASGGLAFVTGGLVKSTAMPGTEKDLWDWIRTGGVVDKNGDPLPLPASSCEAVIEKVGGFMASGGTSQLKKNVASGHTMFTFGASYGGLRMALIAAGIPFEEVTPQTWQKGLGIPPRKKTESKTAWKNRLKARAQQAFPKEKITLATADALLVALYCKRLHEGKL